MKKIVLSILFVFVFIASSFAEVYKYSYVCTYKVKAGVQVFTPIGQNAVLNVNSADKVCLYFVNNIPTPVMYRMNDYKETDNYIRFTIFDAHSITVFINKKLNAAMLLSPKFVYFLQNTTKEIKNINQE